MKERRQRFITEMIASDPIRSQAEIVARLRKKGFAVTQASVSRDLEDIGIRKQKGFYTLTSQSGFSSAIGKVVLESSGSSLIIAKCSSGLASALAVHLDDMNLSDIVGTIAGDDTVFIAAKNSKGQTKVLKALKEYFGD